MDISFWLFGLEKKRCMIKKSREELARYTWFCSLCQFIETLFSWDSLIAKERVFKYPSDYIVLLSFPFSVEGKKRMLNVRIQKRK